MKKNLFRFLLLLGVLLFLTSPLLARLEIETYYPPPVGEYNTISLNPQTTQPADCQVGMIYANSEDRHLYICKDDGDGGVAWTAVSPLWGQSEDNIYPLDTEVNSDLRVGIGTSTPLFKLSLDQDGGIIAHGTIDNGLDLGDPGAGTMFFWYPKKSAIRAGVVDLDQFNEANVGKYSVAFGHNSIASGEGSAVLSGENNTVSTDWSVIAGGQTNTISSGDYAAILGGTGNTVNANYGLIFGQNNTVNGIGSFAMGDGHTINGLLASITGGQSNTADGNFSVISGGNNNIALGVASVVGAGTNNEANGNGAFVGAGTTNVVDGAYSIITGGENNTNAAAYATISGGLDNTINIGADYASIIGGQTNTIEANATHSIIVGGESNTITTNGTHAFIGGGSTNSADGNYAAVLGGENNFADGDYSVVSGSGNHSDAANSWVGGENIVLDAAASNTFAWGHYGAATTITKSDAFLITTGQVGVGTTTIGAAWKMKIVGDVLIEGDLKISDTTTTSDMVINGTCEVAGEEFGIGGQPVPPSDVRLKKDITPLIDNLSKIKKINGISFLWRNEEFPERNLGEGQQIGIIAQEIEKIYPQVVLEDKDGYKYIHYQYLVVPLIEAVKEFHQKLTALQDENRQLKKKLDILEASIQRSAP